MFDKRAQALAALRAAELQTGVVPTSLNTKAQTPNVSKPTVAESESGVIVAEPDSPNLTNPTSAFSQLVPLPTALEHLFPKRVIAPGSVISVRGARSLALELLGAISQAGMWIAIVGAPDVGLVSLAQAGIELGRVALIPEPGLEVSTVCAGLLDGLCLLVGRNIVLSDAEKRRLTARARERGTMILTENAWPGAHLTFAAVSRKWEGSEAGEGQLAKCELLVARTGKGSAAKPQLMGIALNWQLPLAVGNR